MDRLGAMELFVQVADSGSLSAAARVLGMTPSAASKQLAKLEDRLGVRLLNRTTRRIAPTEEGRAYLERARRLLDDLAETEQAIADLGGGARGTLRVDLPSAFGRLFVTPLIPSFLAANPEVRIDLSFNDRFVDLVGEGIDLAVRIGELADSSLIARRLFANRRVVCATPGYFADHGRPRVPGDLVGHNCIVYTYRATRYDWRFRTPSGAEETVRVAGNFEANSAEAVFDALLAGQGVALQPLWLVGRDLQSGRLEEVLSGYHAPDSSGYIIYPPGRHLSTKVRRFIDHLVAGLGREDLWQGALREEEAT
ncbi:MAG: LysR family transcriptional regulator [Pseudomonadota bacterium]